MILKSTMNQIVGWITRQYMASYAGTLNSFDGSYSKCYLKSCNIPSPFFTWFIYIYTYTYCLTRRFFNTISRTWRSESVRNEESKFPRATSVPREKLLWGSPKNSKDPGRIHRPIDMDWLVNQKYLVSKKQWIVPSPCNSGDDYRSFFLQLDTWSFRHLRFEDCKTWQNYMEGFVNCEFCSQECPLESSCGHCFQWQPGWGRKGPGGVGLRSPSQLLLESILQCCGIPQWTSWFLVGNIISWNTQQHHRDSTPWKSLDAPERTSR